MSGWVSLSVCAPTAFLGLSLCGLLLTIKGSKRLRKTFLLRELPMKTAHPLPPSYKSILKRLVPLYGVCTYRSIQYELPPAAHAYLFLWYLSILWSASMVASIQSEGFTVHGALLSAFFATLISLVVCLAL